MIGIDVGKAVGKAVGTFVFGLLCIGVILVGLASLMVYFFG